MAVQMKLAVFKPSSIVSTLSFLHNFKMARDSNSVHEKASMCLLQYFMKDPTKATLAHPLCTAENCEGQKQFKLTR